MLVHKVLQAIKEYHMLDHGDHVIVGVSGGADSVALLAILNTLKEQLKLTLTVAHLNHGLRGTEARQEAEFVRQLAREMGLVCVIEERDVRACKQEKKISLQEAGREARYQFFLELYNRLGARKIALGHHADDQAETLLMWLLRGTSLNGLSGIPPVRDTIVIRPLIKVSRKELESYLNESHIPYIPDSSAGEPQYLRNKIRHQLLPLLKKEYNPNLVEGLTRLSALLRWDSEVLEELVKQESDKILTPGAQGEAHCLVTDINKYPHALQSRIIRHIISSLKGGSRGLEFRHIQAVCRLLDSSGPSKTIQLPDGWAVLREYDKIIFTADRQKQLSYCYAFESLPGHIRIKEINQEIVFAIESLTPPGETLSNKEKNVEFLDYDKIKLPLTVRSYLPGDRFYPLGLEGSQKLKDFFIDRKIPVRSRHRIPVLLSQGQIAWVGGLRIDQRFRVTPGTQKVLKIGLYKG